MHVRGGVNARTREQAQRLGPAHDINPARVSPVPPNPRRSAGPSEADGLVTCAGTQHTPSRVVEASNLKILRTVMRGVLDHVVLAVRTAAEFDVVQ